MKIPPVAHTHTAPKAPHEGKVQTILDSHCAEYPKGTHAGCNLVVMTGKESYLLHVGEILPNGPQNWGSTSKQFTAACIDKLVKEGKISYHDDIRKICPDLPEFKLNGIMQKVTVDDLLHMRSGIPEVWALAIMAGYDGEKLNNEEMLELLDKHPGMVFPPGSKEMYCNTNYYLLAKIIEDVSKRSFIDYVREDVLEPLGMQARCSIDPSCLETIPGYNGDPFSKTPMKIVTSPNVSYGTTGLIGPPSDMIHWNAAIARGDYDLLEPPKGFEGSSEKLYCRGLYVDRKDDYRMIFHGGALNGAVTIYRRYEHTDPNKTFAFFLTTNVDNIGKAEETADKVANELASKEIEIRHSVQEQEQIQRNRETDAQAFSGIYRCQEFGTDWVVQPIEIEPGKWAVRMKLTDGKNFLRLSWIPKSKMANLSSNQDTGKLLLARRRMALSTIPRTWPQFIS